MGHLGDTHKIPLECRPLSILRLRDHITHSRVLHTQCACVCVCMPEIDRTYLPLLFFTLVFENYIYLFIYLVYVQHSLLVEVGGQVLSFHL